jgi:hypothetical protein
MQATSGLVSCSIRIIVLLFQNSFPGELRANETPQLQTGHLIVGLAEDALGPAKLKWATCNRGSR